MCRLGTEDIKAHGAWDGKVHHTYVETGVAICTVLPAFNWGRNLDSYEAYWEGNDNDIPQCLKDKVLPGLDEVYEIAKRVSKLK